MKAHYLTTNSLRRPCQLCIAGQQNAIIRNHFDVFVQMDDAHYLNSVSNRSDATSITMKTFVQLASTVSWVAS